MVRSVDSVVGLTCCVVRSVDSVVGLTSCVVRSVNLVVGVLAPCVVRFVNSVVRLVSSVLRLAACVVATSLKLVDVLLICVMFCDSVYNPDIDVVSLSVVVAAVVLSIEQKERLQDHDNYRYRLKAITNYGYFSF